MLIADPVTATATSSPMTTAIVGLGANAALPVQAATYSLRSAFPDPNLAPTMLPTSKRTKRALKSFEL